MTFGTLEITQSILDHMFNWLYSTKSVETSYSVIKQTILKELVGYIFGSNDFLREQVSNIFYFIILKVFIFILIAVNFI